MLENNNLIIIYGKAGSYKSSLGLSILNSCDKKCCYINLEGKNHVDEIDKCIEENDVILIDYIELANYKEEDIINLKNKAKELNKHLILISCCSNDKDIFNDNYNMYKSIADLVITLDK